MKKTFSLLCVLTASIFFVSCKTSSPTAPVTNDTGTATAVGTPIGSPTTATIDASGGSLVSPDGRLEVIVPANALSTSTAISIQPITNTAPLGAGNGYSLTPDGQKFSQPVTLRFHYTPNDLLGTDANTMAIATQKADRIWYAIDNKSHDPVSKTLSISTTHFSPYCIVDYLWLDPSYASIPVNATQALHLEILKPAPDNDPDDNAIPLMYEPYAISSEVSWSINGASQGNPSDGTVFPISGSSNTIYTAPSTTKNMSSNPVAVSATLYSPGIPEKIIMLSNITVSDGPTVSGRISLSATISGSKTKDDNTIVETKTEEGSGDFVYDISKAPIEDGGGGEKFANWNDAAFGGTANWVSVHTTSYNYICDAVKDRIITDKETTTQTFSSASAGAQITGVGLTIAADGSYTISIGPSLAAAATTLTEKVYSGYCMNPPPESRTNQSTIPFSQYFIPYVGGSGQKTTGKIDPAQPNSIKGTYHGTDNITMFSYNTTTITMPLEYTITWDLTITK